MEILQQLLWYKEMDRFEAAVYSRAPVMRDMYETWQDGRGGGNTS